MGKYDSVIADYEGYFAWYLYLPIISAILLGVSFFIVGVILAALVDEIFLLLWLGILLAPVVYFLSKVFLSYHVLQIYYLGKIASPNCTADDSKREELYKKIKKINTQEELCKKIKNTNIKNEKNPIVMIKCPDCFYPMSKNDECCPNCGYKLQK